MIEAISTLITTTFLLLGSPGPAPLALAATGASHGFRNGVPFLAGILSGLAVAIIGAIAGLATLFANFPDLRFTVQIVGGAYICFIAFKIATAPTINGDSDSIPNAPSFAGGFILNLLNPKAYAAFFAIFSGFLLPLAEITLSFLATGIICFLVAVIVDILWLYFGDLLRPLFRKPREARILRTTFAILMVAAVFLAFAY
jgi:threonine/homoserine/homoserine lactone efflux protein